MSVMICNGTPGFVAATRKAASLVPEPGVGVSAAHVAEAHNGQAGTPAEEIEVGGLFS
jgi:hypothetical protein